MMNQEKFLQDLNTLLKIAKTNGNAITKEEIQDYFGEMILNDAQWEVVYQYITSQNVTIYGFEFSEAEEFEEMPEETVVEETEDDPMDEAVVNLYLNELSGKNISKDGQAELIAKMAAGDVAARDKLIEGNLDLVTKIAASYKNKGLPMGDLIQEGNIGLLLGVSMYDAESGMDFQEFLAGEIKNAIEMALEENKVEAMSAKKVADRANRLDEVATALAKELGREATAEELAVKMGLSEEEVKDIMKISLDAVNVLASGRGE